MLDSTHKLNLKERKHSRKGNGEFPKQKWTQISESKGSWKATKSKSTKEIFGIITTTRGLGQDPVEDNPLRSSTNQNHKNF